MFYFSWAVSFFHENQENPLFLIFRTDFLVKNNPRRVCCRLADLLGTKLPKQCLHSRVPGGFSSDPVRGRPGFSQVSVHHVCVLFTVLRPCRLRHSAAKWSTLNNTMVSFDFQDFPHGPNWLHRPPRCLPDAPQRAPDASQMSLNPTVWVLALESFAKAC